MESSDENKHTLSVYQVSADGLIHSDYSLIL